MKKPCQVSKENSVKPRSLQSQKRKAPRRRITTVRFYSPDDNRELARVDFPAPVFAAVERGAKTLGVSLEHFFEEALSSAFSAADDEAASAARPKLTDREARRLIEGDEAWVTIRLSPQMRRLLRAYGRNNVISAGGNLARISEAALEIAMLHLDFIKEASNRFVRYAKAEGFVGPDEQQRLFDSLLAAR